MSDQNNISTLMEIGGGHTISFRFNGKMRSVVFITLVANGKLALCKDRNLATGEYVEKTFTVAKMAGIRKSNTFTNPAGKRVAGR
jgi:hypothetical protein